MASIEKLEYAEKLKDPRWQKKRLEIFERDKWTCQGCLRQDSTLVCHHRYYLADKEPWEYPDDALATLCEECHAHERDMRTIVEERLLRAFRHYWFANNLLQIARCVEEAEMTHLPAVVADAWAYSISDPPTQRMLIERLIQSLKQKRLERRKANEDRA
jgi:hypothetical protein